MLTTALLLGLLSSLHCIGMCGPIALMLPLDRSNKAKKAAQLLLYHFGRITAYGSLGLFFGLAGKGFYLAGLQQQLSIIAGLLMIIIALVPEKVLARYNFSRPVYRLISGLKSSLGAQLKSRGALSFYLTGLLNGFLPCGLVYAALFGALAMQSPSLGVAYMVLYGIGTIPMMSAVVYASGFIGTPLRNLLNRAVPFFMVVVGMLFIMRGLGLGIPYLSPGTAHLFIQQNPHCGAITKGR